LEVREKVRKRKVLKEREKEWQKKRGQLIKRENEKRKSRNKWGESIESRKERGEE